MKIKDLLECELLVGGGGGGYPEPEGSVTIQTNGTYNVKDKATAIVDVPQPSGNKAITENGTHNVKDYAYAVVNVSGYPEPSGEFTIYSNGYYDCKDYENVDVQVENAPTHEWVQAESIDSIEFSYGLEGVNFIIIGENLDGGVYLIWHTEGDEEHEFAVWDGGCTFQTIYDTSRLGEGVIALNNDIDALSDGYHFVIGGNYHLYWW